MHTYKEPLLTATYHPIRLIISFHYLHNVSYLTVLAEILEAEIHFFGKVTQNNEPLFLLLVAVMTPL